MSLENLRVLSVLPVLGHPRDSKRIAMLQQAGFAVEAVAFERDYHSGRLPSCPVESLGKIAHGRYLQRSLKLLKTLLSMRRFIRRNKLIYASGPDMALFALIAGLGLHRPVILEIGDIQAVQVAKGLRGCLIRAFDRYVVNASRLLVATAPGFVDHYYREWLNSRTPALVLENKLEIPVSEADRIEVRAPMEGTPLVDRRLRIGYFGLLRCGWSWQVLEALALSRRDEVEIVVAGYPMNPIDLPERAAKLSNVDFLGEFRSPQDLLALYGDVDLVWGCYPKPGQGDWNWRWARTNRFYESCFFQRPIIALAGSSDAAEVVRYGIGMTVGGASIEGAVDVLCEITSGNLTRWQENLSKLPRKVYVYTTEIDELERAIIEIVGDNFPSIKK